MYVSPVLSKNTAQTPKEYTNRARDEITKKLNLKASTTTQLRHGSSPLKYVANASDSSPNLSKTNSSESLDLPMALNQDSQLSKEKSKSKLFGLSRLRSLSSMNNSSSSLKTVTRAEDQEDQQDQDVQMEGYEEYLELHPVPSISSSFSSQSSVSTAPSMATNTDSLFSNNTIQTQATNISQYSGDSTIIPQSHQQYQSHQPQQYQSQLSQFTDSLTLQEALPHSFHDMYAPELLADPSLLIDGRPMFTKRALLDWDLNDIRSLLIYEQLKPEWNGKLPTISSPAGFKLEYLPLDADDDTVIRTLVESDIYKEAKFDINFRVQTAKYTLNAARSRHAMFLQNSGIPLFYNNRLSKPEWRNVIENFLLNLAVEAQCRYDFKKACHEQKKFKRNQSSQSSSSSGGNSLLRKALLNDVNKDSPVKLTKDDKAKLWTQVQTKVYKRIGLDWTPDTL